MYYEVNILKWDKNILKNADSSNKIQFKDKARWLSLDPLYPLRYPL